MAEPAAACVLSDGTIRRLVESGRIAVDPFDPQLIQPASIDLRLGDSFRVFHNHRAAAIDLREPPQGLTEEVGAGEDGFVIHPGEFCLGRTLEWVELPDDVVARIEGKALAVDTEVPTPAGWRTMGELAVGDLVFAPDGRPVPVVAVSEVMHERPCRAVRLSDGETVIADADHLWEVHPRRGRTDAGVRALSTRVLERAIRRGPGGWAYEVGAVGAVEYPPRELPLDPFALGAWIGDGSHAQAAITAARVVGRDRAGRNRGATAGALRALGLFDGEHIPAEYLTAAPEQRRALLAGLMETAGDVDARGRRRLTAGSPRLAVQCLELVASLGHRPSLSAEDGGRRRLAYRVAFAAEPHGAPGRSRLAVAERAGARRAIVDVRPVRSVPVRCIEVGASRGTYLVTRSFVPTHNSSLGRLGLIVHATAGFIDPGWKGTLTLELNNLTRVPIKLYPGLLIAQLSFMALDRPAERPYGSAALGSHYQGQVAATESRYMR